MELHFPRPAEDFNFDRIQVLILHPQAELFLCFDDAVLLEAITHDRQSTDHRCKATAKFIIFHPKPMEILRRECPSEEFACAAGASERPAGGLDLEQIITQGSKSPPPTCGFKCKQPFSTFHLLVGKSGCPNPRHWPGLRPSNKSHQPASFSACVRDTGGCGLLLVCPRMVNDSVPSQSSPILAAVNNRRKCNMVGLCS
jgi:hypothetical protein